MVAAGVFLYGRLFPFFSHFAFVGAFTLAIGTVSMLLSATMAMVSRDIKQVWAYSTISQLGFMLMGLGAGGYFGAMFHLTTHAAFKALLFLCAGVLIHAFHSNDMFAIGRKGGRRMKWPVICMVIGAGALAGIWPLSGFFSKEAILASLGGLPNPLWLLAGLAGVFLTAYYTFRLIFVILLPEQIPAPEGEEEGAPSRYEMRSMIPPLILLGAITACLGFFQAPLRDFLSGDLAHGLAHGPPWLLPASLGLALSAVGLTWLEFGRKGAAQIGFAEKQALLYRLFSNRWYLDHIYRWGVDQVLDSRIAALCQKNDDHVVDGGVRLLARGVQASAASVAGWHRALIQKKLMAVFAVVFGFILILLIVR
jgi:NADH-quinone oxidoreductase subunit L